MTNSSASFTAISQIVPGISGPPQDLTEVFDILTHQTQNQLGDIAQTVFFFGDGIQRALTDGIFELFDPQTWTPGNVLRTSSEAIQQATRLSQLLAPGQASLAWQELRNKLEVFVLVKNLSSVLKLPANELLPLLDLVERAYSIAPFGALWAVEGLGHYYACTYWDHKGVPEGLLFEENASVPEKSLLMLHAGIGLCFAERLLGELTSEASSNQVHDAVESFVLLCRRNSREGYLGAAIESLGLVARDFYPDLLSQVEAQLRRVEPDFLGYFWHGAGRAVYFSRQYFLPVLGSIWSGVESEASKSPERLSAVAGVTWAMTLVNMRQPAIMENAVRTYIEHSDLAQGFTDGLISSIIMRTDTTPEASFTSEFYQHQPGAGDAELAATWQHLISGPARAAVQNYYPVLKRHNCLDQVFRYQDLGALVSCLEHDKTASDSGACWSPKQ